jgi:dehydrogenase/reductase SDR family member 12
MICRSAERGEAARNEIVSLTQNDKVRLLLADVGELEQVRSVVKKLQEQEPKVDCLVCNAGVLLNNRTETKEGREATYASHFLGGSYLLSQLLVPQLKASATDDADKKETTEKPRVIFVTSGGMLITKLPSWDMLTSSSEEAKAKYDGNYAYGYAKRGQVLLAERLAQDEPQITWITAHPGWSGTNAVDEAFGDNKKYLEPLRSTWEGAEGISWLMHADKLVNGALYLDRVIQKKHIAGPFMSEGTYTKNKPSEVDEMMENLKKDAGL